MKYYVLPENALGYRQVINETQGVPVDMTGIDIVDLPNGAYLTVISKGKEYPSHKIANAIAAGQVNIDDVK